MHPEIEKLIDLALADGQITEKERNVILRKAAELGVNADEVEMTLDGRLHQLDASKQKQREKFGNVKSCPACGSSVKAMESNCFDCGHEFFGTKANSTLLKLLAEIEKIKNKEITPPPQILQGAAGEQLKTSAIEYEKNKLKKELIENFPIPNTREDILEFLAFSLSKGKDNSISSYFQHNTSSAWTKKAEEVIIKSKIMFKNDPEFFRQLENYDLDLRSSIKSQNILRNFIIGVAAIIAILCYGSIMLSELLKK